MFKQVEFQSEATPYVRKRLLQGKTLSKFLLQSHDLDSGIVTIKLPVTVDDEAAKDFESGGKLSMTPVGKDRLSNLEPIPNMDNFLVEELRTFLQSQGNRLCLFEDASASAGDPYLTSVETRISTFENEVYHMLCRSDNTEDKVLKTIRLARSWLFIGILTSTITDLCSNQHSLTVDELRLLAQQTQKIVIGAYDGEGYLVWEKR